VAVVALVQAPVLRHRQPHLVELVERDPQRADCALQHRGKGEVEAVAAGLQRAARGARLLDALRRQVDVGPAGETVLSVPVGLAVTQQNELMHKAGRAWACRSIIMLVFPVEISFFHFIQKGYNPLLAITALVSGGMLLWPLLRRSTGGPSVATWRAIQLINREDALVVDVRASGDYAAGHILGAKNLPLGRIEEGAGEIAKRKEKPLIVYDDGGERSAKAAAALKKQGFTQVAT